MVTRVDKKPIIYATTCVRAWRPITQQKDDALLRSMIKKSVGHKIPDICPIDLMDDIDGITRSFSLFEDDEDYFEEWGYWEDDADDESIRLARMLVPKQMGRRAMLKNSQLCYNVCKVIKRLVNNSNYIYYGTEAVYQVYTEAIHNNVFEFGDDPHYWEWAKKTALSICELQAPYLMIHPSATRSMAEEIGKDINWTVLGAWNMFKKLETIALRLGSRKNLFAHAHYSGSSRRHFDPAEEIEEDFEVPLTGFAKCKQHIKLYNIAGLRYIKIGSKLMILTHDDSVNLATMAQCYFRVALYFIRSNGYVATASERALGLVRDIALHACMLIDCGKNFSHIIRSMHILAQKDFNDVFEEKHGANLGWEGRSANYVREANELDEMGKVFHARAKSLAIDTIDELNVGFIYHAFVGDEMITDDLRSKVKNMTGKVRSADEEEWSTFIRFCKSYMLCRYMMTHKRKPKVDGDLSLMNTSWAERCCSGVFTMPPFNEWGKVWICGEFAWSTFANSWHLEAQDVSYVMKDSKGLKKGKYNGDRIVNSELLMAMTSGDILDTLTQSTATSARERICSGIPPKEVVLTTAPKAENAKPSWKKRVTFAADCEFRKMQAEYDRNCRKVMTFVRGPSLGVDQNALEKQFHDICSSTTLGLRGAVCSHDISAWSESMERKRKFEFEEILINMLTKPDMLNISLDWQEIKATVLKGGARDIVAIDNSSFQGFDGSASTILHSMILIYCIDSARRKGIMPTSVKANMATLIDDCVALMRGLDDGEVANQFWSHLKETYMKLGFEVDDLKSIFSTIKAIYLSRRFVLGGEVPADLKVFIKSHISYEDPLRCALDTVSDIFGANRGAADANGDPWFIYHTSCFNTLLELAHANPNICSIPASAASVFSLAPVAENGWGLPSIIDWGTNDITDKRCHFNAIMEAICRHKMASDRHKDGVDPYTRPAAKALGCIKAQAWRLVSYSNLFTNPFDAIREGPLKPDMLRRNAVSDLLKQTATAEPWCTLLKWSSAATTKRIREYLVGSGPLHAPTLSALVNCMPDNYRLSLVGKAVGSSSVLDLLPMGERALLKRRVHRCSSNYFQFTVSMYESCNTIYEAADVACLSFKERTVLEREEFYTINSVQMTDHTFPDPVGTFTHANKSTNSMISPNISKLRRWDTSKEFANRLNHFVGDKGIYTPRRSGRVWEITSEYAKGWDTVSQRVAMGLAVLARARADGHAIAGLQEYFIKSWNEMSNITPDDTHLISIHGSIKRLDSNPGSASHPIIFNRNILSGLNNTLTTATNAIPVQAKSISGSTSHLHDILAHETCMLAVTCLHLGVYSFLGVASSTLSFGIATRPDCVLAEDPRRMQTDSVVNAISLEILDSAEDYGLLQACPKLASCIAIPTMKGSWANMINNLIDGNHEECEAILRDANTSNLDDLLDRLAKDETEYSAYVVVAEAPAKRSTIKVTSDMKYAIRGADEESKMKGDAYTLGVRTITSSLNRDIISSQPEHVACAVAIKSIIWEKMRLESCEKLAKIFYEDPECDTAIMRQFTKLDFWRHVVKEAARHKKKLMLSELIMSGLRSLGVPGIHISASKDVDAVAQAVSSYFGARLKDVIKLVSAEVLSIAGRSSRDFERPLMERIITNNPALSNAKMRRTHMKKLIEFNMKSLTERIIAIEQGKVKHRGDARASEINMKKRLIELRCRRYTYGAAVVNEAGKAHIDEEKLGDQIHKCAVMVAERINVPVEEVPKKPTTFFGILQFMKNVEVIFDKHQKLTESGWDELSGNLGVRLAYNNVNTDSEHVSATRFAVSASEIAPRIHKRIIHSQPREPILSEWESNYGDGSGTGEEEALSFEYGSSSSKLVSIDEAMNMSLETKPIIFLPKWQALYTLAYTGSYTPDELNSILGTELSAPVTCAQLREAKLNEFDDDDLDDAFPTIAADYLASSTPFNPIWLERDEADAYMVDEVGNVPTGSLF